MNLWFLLGDPTKHNHGYDHVGSGTEAAALGLVVERNPVAAPGILASAHLHVVRRDRRRPDGAGGIAGGDQHRARLESAARPLHQAAQKLPQQRPQDGSAFGVVGAGCAAAVPKSIARQWPAGPGRGWHQDRQTRQENAGRQAFASAIGIQHQARIHHGAFLAGCRPAGPRGSECLLRAARRAHPRRPGMVQS
jgi:hypothetical protein